MKYGSPEYFQALDQQVSEILAPQLAAGIMKPEQAFEIRATALRRADKQVSRFYGMTNKYDGKGRLKA